MSPDILVLKYPSWIHSLSDPTELIKLGVQAFELFRLQVVLLRPVRPAVERLEDVGEPLLEFFVWYRQPIWPS